MRLYLEGRKIFIKLPEDELDRRAALGSMSSVIFHGWKDKTTLWFDTSVFSELGTAKMVNLIRHAARLYKRVGAEISDEVQALFDEYKAIEAREREERLKKEEEESKRMKAQSYVANGCRFCVHLKLDERRNWYCGKHEKRCLQNAREVEMLFEVWKENGYKGFQTPTPYPVNECEYVKELQKNGCVDRERNET